MLNTFVAFDLETTGLNPPCKIIEIGGVKVVNGTIVDSFERFVNPEIPIPSYITKITGISDNMISNAQNINNVLPEFLIFIENHTLIAHNASFDMRFVNHYAYQQGLIIKNNVTDTLAICRKKYPYLKNHKLKTISDYFKITHDNAHRALSDAMAVASIYLHFLSHNLD